MDNSTLQQQLWELHYELLSPEDAAALQQRIADEADVAALDRLVRQQLELVDDATRWPMEMEWKVPVEMRTESASATDLAKAATGRTNLSSAATRWGWLIAAAALLLVSGMGWNWLSQQNVAGVRENHRLLAQQREMTRFISVATEVQQGVRQVNVLTTDLQGNAKPVDFQFRVDSHGGRPAYTGSVTSNEAGLATVYLPEEFTGQTVSLHLSAAQNSTTQFPVRVGGSMRAPMTLARAEYYPGDTVVFGAMDQRPVVNEDVPVRVTVHDPGGEVIAVADVRLDSSQGIEGAFLLPADARAGAYEVKATIGELDELFAAQTFRVSPSQNARYEKQIAWDRDEYRPGESAVARVEIRESGGKAVSNARMFTRAWIGGERIYEGYAFTNQAGKAELEIPLPEIDQGVSIADSYVSVTVEKAYVETLRQQIPLVVTKEVHVAWNPDGGRLVANIPNQVFFAATDPQGESVAFAGILADQQGKKIAPVECLEDGLTTFEFTPKLGEVYELVAKRDDVQLVGLSKFVAESQAPTFRVEQAIVKDREPLRLRLLGSQVGTPLLVSAHVGQHPVAHLPVWTAEAATQSTGQLIEWQLPRGVQGNVWLALHDCRQSAPAVLAGRMVHIRGEQRLQIGVDYSDSNSLNLSVKDRRGRAVDATVDVALVRASSLGDGQAAIPQEQLLGLLTSAPADHSSRTSLSHRSLDSSIRIHDSLPTLQAELTRQQSELQRKAVASVRGPQNQLFVAGLVSLFVGVVLSWQERRRRNWTALWLCFVVGGLAVFMAVVAAPGQHSVKAEDVVPRAAFATAPEPQPVVVDLSSERLAGSDQVDMSRVPLSAVSVLGASDEAGAANSPVKLWRKALPVTADGGVLLDLPAVEDASDWQVVVTARRENGDVGRVVRPLAP